MISLKDKSFEEQLTKFITSLAKLDGAQICGVARIMSVVTDYQEEEGGKRILRDGNDVVRDMVKTYLGLGRVQRRRLLALMKKAGG
jgi:hypothetical protein